MIRSLPAVRWSGSGSLNWSMAESACCLGRFFISNDEQMMKRSTVTEPLWTMMKHMITKYTSISPYFIAFLLTWKQMLICFFFGITLQMTYLLVWSAVSGWPPSASWRNNTCSFQASQRLKTPCRPSMWPRPTWRRCCWWRRDISKAPPMVESCSADPKNWTHFGLFGKLKWFPGPRLRLGVLFLFFSQALSFMTCVFECFWWFWFHHSGSFWLQTWMPFYGPNIPCGRQEATSISRCRPGYQAHHVGHVRGRGCQTSSWRFDPWINPEDQKTPKQKWLG